jgi:hypothetical protein
LTCTGLGDRKTPPPFVTACNRFIYVENLVSHEAHQEEHTEAHSAVHPAVHPVVHNEARHQEHKELHPPQATQIAAPQQYASASQVTQDSQLVARLRAAVEAASHNDHWPELGRVYSILTHRHPDFDSRNYGYPVFSDLVTATNMFEIYRNSEGAGTTYIRAKAQAHATSK